MIELLQSFNAGELSPMLDARTTLDKYKSGCAQLQNFIIMPYGGVNRRPGTEYMAPAKYSNRKCRLVGFNFSTTTTFILEIGHLYIRFFASRTQVLSGGSPYEISSPYQEADLKELQITQINDVVYIAHANYPPYKLSRIADTNWTLTKVSWLTPPTMDENITTTTITPSAASGNISLHASSAIFQSAHVGSQWQLLWVRNTGSLTGSINANGYSTGYTTGSIDLTGNWDFYTFGTWNATIRILRNSEANVNAGIFDVTKMEVIREWTSASDRNVTANGTETDRCQLVVQILNYTSNTNGRFTLESRDFKTGGVVTITSYAGPQDVYATVNSWLGNSYATPTVYWSEGAFSDVQGYPKAVTMHQQRLFFGGNKTKPNTLWGSQINDFENFKTGALDTDSLRFTLAASEGNRINWMLSQQQLLIGTTGDEWSIGAADTSKAFSASNVLARRQSSYGSKYMRAIMVNDVMLFVQRNGRKVRELVYSFQKDGWVAADLTLLAEHITQGQINEIAYQSQPDAILWGINGNGYLTGMTYERDQQVVGWHRHVTDGTFESVATCYGNGTEDEVWMVVNRTINGATVRYIESFRLNWRYTLDQSDKTNWFYVDAGKQIVNGSPSATVTGLSHLIGKTVSILADGNQHPPLVVDGTGSITLQYPATTVNVGLPYASILEPMKFDASLQDGTAQGRKQRLHRVRARFYKSLGGDFSSNGTDFDTIPARDINDPMDSSPPVFSGEKHLTIASGYSDNARIILRQNNPLPMTVIAIVTKWEPMGD